MTRAYSRDSVLFLAALFGLVACGGNGFQSGDGDSASGGAGAGSGGETTGTGGSADGGSGGASETSASSGGRTSSSSNGSGGTSSGSGGSTAAGGSGGSANGGSGGGGANGGSGGSPVRGQCEAAADCVAAADFGDPCYSEGCSLPVGVSEADVENDVCLVLWERRADGRPAGCELPDEETVCPLGCAQPPQCIEVACHNAQCQLDFGYDDETCSATTGGSGGTGGSTAGSGGTGGDDCNALNEARQEALTAAVGCNPEVDAPQCTGSSTVPDQCGCPTLVNDYDEAQVSAAQEAYDAWVEAGCGPYPCGAACFYAEEGDCDQLSSTCVWKGLN